MLSKSGWLGGYVDFVGLDDDYLRRSCIGFDRQTRVGLKRVSQN